MDENETVSNAEIPLLPAPAGSAADSNAVLPSPPSRRNAMLAVGAGALALAATHTGAAYYAADWARQEPLAQNAALQAEVQRLRDEGKRLRELVGMYETLEKVGLDALAALGLTTVKGLLDNLRGGLVALANGVSGVEILLGNFTKSFATLRQGLQIVEGIVKTVAELLTTLQRFVGDVTTPVKPLVMQLKEFFDNILSFIPVIGDNIRRTSDALVALVNELPNLVLNINTQLLEPLRTTWLSDQTAQNLQGALVDPIVKNVLEPAKAQLKNADLALTQWEKEVRTPVQAALDQRNQIRLQITDYRQKNNL